MTNQLKILIVEDEADQRAVVSQILESEGYQVSAVDDAESALIQLHENAIDLVYSDWQLPGMDGLTLMTKIRDIQPDIAYIIATGHGSIEHAVAAIHAGADDYLSKPFNKQTLLFTIQKVAQTKRLISQNKQLKQALGLQEQLVDMIGKSAKMQTMFKRVEKLASTRATVLITGESGTGKELAARALHELSNRNNQAFIAINCAAIPESLAEAEFFGAAKGAYTGANSNKKGKFELADNGTIFLDEIGELDLAIQAKLLRLLQEGTFTPIGGQQELRADVRVLAATNRNLEDEIKAGQFREDLYFRLNVVPIVMPPLRERKDDIPLLASHFLKKASQQHGLKEVRLSSSAFKALEQHYWPGNVRELNNVIERAVLLTEAKVIEASDLDFETSTRLDNNAVFTLPPEGMSWQQIERDVLKQALGLADSNRAEAARLLDLPYKAFLYRLEKYNL